MFAIGLTHTVDVDNSNERVGNRTKQWVSVCMCVCLSLVYNEIFVFTAAAN